MWTEGNGFVRRRSISRRELLQVTGGGIGWLAARAMLRQEACGASKQPAFDHAPTAKAVVQIFCPGGMSHVDTFDYKPELAKRSGKPFDPDGELDRDPGMYL